MLSISLNGLPVPVGVKLSVWGLVQAAKSRCLVVAAAYVYEDGEREM